MPPLSQPPSRGLSLVSPGPADNTRVNSGAAKTVAVVDHCMLTRDCIVAALKNLGDDWEIACLSSIDDLWKPEFSVDIAILHCDDLDVPGGLSTSGQQDLRSLAEKMRIIVMASNEDPATAAALLVNGVRGYVPTKSTGLSLLTEIIRLVSVGGTFAPPSSLLALRDSGATPAVAATAHQLTSREKDVFELLRRGKPNKCIAHELGLSESTVKSHIQAIMKKLNATNRTEAVCRALESA